MEISQQSDEDNAKLIEIHSKMFKIKRSKDFETYKIVESKSKYRDKDISKYKIIEPILEKAYAILDKYKINYDRKDKRYLVEFQRRNCFETANNKFQWSVWHKDNDALRSYRAQTLIFYLRKDICVHGGNFEYKINNEHFQHYVAEKDTLCFSGDLMHYPTPTWGVGCRDIIVVLIKI